VCAPPTPQRTSVVHLQNNSNANPQSNHGNPESSIVLTQSMHHLTQTMRTQNIIMRVLRQPGHVWQVMCGCPESQYMCPAQHLQNNSSKLLALDPPCLDRASNALQHILRAAVHGKVHGPRIALGRHLRQGPRLAIGRHLRQGFADKLELETRQGMGTKCDLQPYKKTIPTSRRGGRERNGNENKGCLCGS
jgi:hypothetical protein